MTDVAQPTAPPDRVPDYARRDDKDRSLAFQQDIAKETYAERNRPVRAVRPLNMPMALLAGDNIIDFGERVREYTIQNNSGAAIFRELDARATPGSFQIAASDTLNEQKSVRKLHLYVTVGCPCNDAIAGVVVEGGA